MSKKKSVGFLILVPNKRGGFSIRNPREDEVEEIGAALDEMLEARKQVPTYVDAWRSRPSSALPN